MSDVGYAAYPGIVQQLKDRRKAWRLSQQRLGDRTGLAEATICRYETGSIRPSIPALFDWAAALGYRIVLVPATKSTKKRKKRKGNVE